MTKLTFQTIVPHQAKDTKVAFFTATVKDIERIANVDRMRRDAKGRLRGFQRPQIASHIREIGDYLRRPDAILANPIVLGFVDGAVLKRSKSGAHELTIDISRGAPGWIVDGQQRFSALSEISRPEFQVPVSAFICKSREELNRQFILINNTRPLPKRLIYELLPYVGGGLAERWDSRTAASRLCEILNYGEGSSLRGMINGQTNPHGVIGTTVLQRTLMHSMSDGALRLYADDPILVQTKGAELISEYFHAVKHVFHDAWENHTPKSSRLLHGVGVTAMGFVMEYIHSATGATKREQFVEPLAALRPVTAWTEGQWQLGSEVRRWNGLQNVDVDKKLLSFHLVRQVQTAIERRSRARNRVRH